MPPTSKPEHQEKFPCLLLHLHPVATPYITRHADILESGKLGKQVVELKDESYPAVAKIGEFPVGEPFDRNTVYAYTTAVGRTERTEYLEQRSLARTARPDNTHHLAPAYGQRNPFQHLQRAVTFMHVGSLYHPISVHVPCRN